MRRMNAQVPHGYASLEQILLDHVRWPDTTLIGDLEWYVNVGVADPPRRVVLLPTSTTHDPVTTLADLREGAQRIVEGEALIRLRYADAADPQPLLEPRAFVMAKT